MIKYLKYEEIDLPRWDYCISNSVNGIIYAYSWYLNIVCEHWDALVEDDYIRVLPLPGRKKFGIRYLYQPFFIQQLGVISQELINEQVVDAFLKAIPAFYRLTEINLNSMNRTNAEGFEVRKNLNHELDLIHDYPEIARNYSQNLKRNLKKWNESGYSLVAQVDPALVVDLFRENRGRNLVTWKDRDYEILQKLLAACKARDLLLVSGVAGMQDKLIAGAIFITSHKKVIFLFSATGRQGREANAMPAIIDQFIRNHCKKELTLDFEGSNDTDLARFYKSFGSMESFYLQIRRSNLPEFAEKLIPVYRSFKRTFLPLFFIFFTFLSELQNFM